MTTKVPSRRSWLLAVVLTSWVVLSAAAGRRSPLQDLTPDAASGAATSNEESAPELTAVNTPLLFTADQHESVQAAVELQQSIASAGISGGDVTAQQLSVISQTALDSHNRYRATHQVGPLAWSDVVAQSASTYANKCTWQHDPNNQAYGENLYATSQTSNTAALMSTAVDNWYSEVRLVDYSKPEEMFNNGAGHFTQLVWKASTQLGCAAVVCPRIAGLSWPNGGTIIVCRYSPPGNYIGRFAANVFPPVNGGTSPPASPSPRPPTGGTPQPSPSPTTGNTFSTRSALQAGMSMTAGSSNCMYSDNRAYSLCIADNGIVTLARVTDSFVLYRTSGRVALASRPAMLWLNDQDFSVQVIDKRFRPATVVYEGCTTCGDPTKAALILRNDGSLVVFARSSFSLTGVQADPNSIIWQLRTTQRQARAAVPADAAASTAP